jgi:hypothetical protein
MMVLSLTCAHPEIGPFLKIGQPERDNASTHTDLINSGTIDSDDNRFDGEFSIFSLLQYEMGRATRGREMKLSLRKKEIPAVTACAIRQT